MRRQPRLASLAWLGLALLAACDGLLGIHQLAGDAGLDSSGPPPRSDAGVEGGRDAPRETAVDGRAHDGADAALDGRTFDVQGQPPTDASPIILNGTTGRVTVLVVGRDDTVFWSRQGEGIFAQAPGSDAYFSISQSTNVNAAAVDTDGMHIFWVEQDAGKVFRSRAMPDSGMPETVGSGPPTAILLAVDPTYVWWVVKQEKNDATDYAVYRVDKDAGDAAGQPFFDGGPSAITSIAVDSTNVYVDQYFSDGILRYVGRSASSFASSNQMTFAADPSHLAIGFDAGVLWYEEAGVQRLIPDQGTGQPIVPHNRNVRYYASDGVHVYWTESVDAGADAAAVGSVHRATLDGSEPTTLAANEKSPTLIVVGSRYVFWAAADVLRFVPK